MKIFLLILFGFLSGIIGGMGMGGGTLLVPLLSFLDMSQKSIQAINLVSFLPMCVVALCFHAKNGLVKPKHVGWVVVPASICAVLGAVFAGQTDNKILRLCFGVFLIAVGVWQIVVAVKFFLNKKRRWVVTYSAVHSLKAIPQRLLDKKRRSFKNRSTQG